MSIDYENNCFPGMVPFGVSCYRFSDKSNQDAERILFDNWWNEIINQYGTEVKYFVNTFNVLSSDNLYGEEPTKVFAEPLEIVMAITLNENAITLSEFGFMSDDEITAYVHISAFYNTFAEPLSDVWVTQYNIVEPKAGDVFQLSEYGDDRPSNRQPKYFEITERLDQDIALTNQLGGHYVFIIKAKRYDYSFEPGIPFNGLSEGIIGNQQIYEDNFSGRLSGGATEETEPKKDNYDEYDVDDVSKNDIFDMSQNDTDVYGDYY